MKVKINLMNDGLALFFKPYEILAWDIVWKSPKPLGSFDVWDKTNIGLGPDKTISRASVIFFLNRMVDLKFMDYETVTGKGGHRRLYFGLVSMTDLGLAISRCMAEKMRALTYESIEYDKGVPGPV